MEKKLTIAHIAPYLPYGLRCQFAYTGEIGIVTSIIDSLEYDHVKIKIGYNDAEHIWMFKPLLLPLSKLAHEIIHGKQKFVPYKKLGWESGDMLISCVKSKTKKDLPYRDAVKLFEWGFDVFSLIPQGLAIEKGAEG